MTGLPHFSYFPFDTLEGSVADPKRFATSQDKHTGNKDLKAGRTEPKVSIPKVAATTDAEQRIDLSTALQYGQATGYAPLLSFVRHFMREVLIPDPPYAGGPEVIMTCGATDGWSKVVEAFTNHWSPDRNVLTDRQAVLYDEYTYMNAVQTVRPRGLNIVPVAMDEYGMRVDGIGGLADILANWDSSKGRRPHLIYTITYVSVPSWKEGRLTLRSCGQNPTGSVMPMSRRRQIYDICHKYDIIITEDEPYWHLQYPSAALATKEPQLHTRKSTGFPFLDSLTPSFLSIDVDGRVVRLDTFSKTVAPGCRLGWLTAQPAVIERIQYIAEGSTQAPSGMAQALVASLIVHPQNPDPKTGTSTRGWDVNGWVRWLEGLRSDYERRMQAMCTILHQKKHLVTATVPAAPADADAGWHLLDAVPMYDLASPRGGMFVWIRVNLPSHPLFSSVPTAKLAAGLLFFLMTPPYLALSTPGHLFDPLLHASPDEYRPRQAVAGDDAVFLRLCFAPIEASQIEEAADGFAEGFRAFWGIDDVAVIDKILKDAGQTEAEADGAMALEGLRGMWFC